MWNTFEYPNKGIFRGMDSGNSNCSLQSSSGGEEDQEEEDQEEEEEEEVEEEEYDSISRPVPPPPPCHQSNLMNPFGSLSSSSSSSHPHNTSLFSNNLIFDPSPNLFQTNFSHQQPAPAAASLFLNLDMLPAAASNSSHHLHNHMLRSGPTSSSSPHDPPSHAIKLLRSHNHHPHPSIITPIPSHNYTTTSTTTVAAAAAAGRGRISDNNNNNNQNQRVVSRNPKKRTRASRRAPTTVLTTDTSNFRAMVQEFTGIPAPPFSAPYSRTTFDLFRGLDSSTTTTTTATMSSLLYPLRPSPHKLPPSFASNNNYLSSDLHTTTPSMMNQMLSVLQSPLSTVVPKSQSDDVDHHQHWGTDAHIANMNQDHHHHHAPTSTTSTTDVNVQQGGFMFHHDDHHKDLDVHVTSSSTAQAQAQGTFDSWISPTTTTD